MEDPSAAKRESLLLDEGALSLGVPFRSGVLGSSLTTIAVGGPVTLVEPADREALTKVCRWASQTHMELRVLGGGSNLLIPDTGCGGIVVKLGRSFGSWKREEKVLTVGGAFSLMRLSRIAAEAGLSGLEFAGGIPASCG